MPVRSDSTIVIAGAGLAGACAALALADSHRVIVLDSGRVGEGASGAAAGLVNPFMGRKAKPAWHYREALDALHATLDAAGAADLFLPSGVLRPASDDRQLEAFKASAQNNGLAWIEADAVAERWPEVQAPHGALWIPEGGSVDLTAMVRACVKAAETRGVEVHEHRRLIGWQHRNQQLIAITDYEPIEADRLLLTLGDGARHLPELATLPLHRVKGQTVELAPSSTDLPAVSGGVYVVPRPDRVLVGATFEHHFEDLRPDPVASSRLVGRAQQLVPTLDGAVRAERVGVRLTVPTSASPRRLPLLAPLPGHDTVWVFSGLGAKGLLTAPRLARFLPHALANPGALPAEIRDPIAG
ncbi:MAG: FAD-dependent oxidoreductase [Bacteroidota bacterium]